MIAVYLSGPISKGDKAKHYQQFCTAQTELLEAFPDDVLVLNPGLTITMPGAFEIDYETWMNQCLAMVELSDVVIRLPGDSDGADREVQHACQNEIEVIGVNGFTELNPVESFKIMFRTGILVRQQEDDAKAVEEAKANQSEGSTGTCHMMSIGSTPYVSWMNSWDRDPWRPTWGKHDMRSRTAPVTRPPVTESTAPPENAVLQMARKMSAECLAIMEEKNADYTNADAGNSPFANFLASETVGVDPGKGILMRMGDKMARLKTFIERGDLKVKGEGWADSCNDLYNYAIILRAYLESAAESEADDE